MWKYHLVDEEGGEAKNSLLLHNGTLLLQANHLQLPKGGELRGSGNLTKIYGQRTIK